MELMICMPDVACGLIFYSVLVQGVMQLYASKVADVKLSGKVSESSFACGY